ncbi:DinB family protein [Sciscionella marina]|uniref:DinB family protein n=1 Tax=Sciscionella marina TaxID=508770 RepID=UPI000363A93D|nr:DinB family protein [Sciscionella marina]
MTTDTRTMPPPVGDERATLAGWLTFYRVTLAEKCAGLSEAQLRTAAVEPSALSLLGLVRHLAEVERNWFRRVLTGEDAPPIYDERADPEGRDGGFAFTEDSTFEQARRIWTEEIAVAERNCAGAERDARIPCAALGGAVTLRWIYTHMIAEYARHDGHADLIRERIDGHTGF